MLEKAAVYSAKTEMYVCMPWITVVQGWYNVNYTYIYNDVGMQALLFKIIFF